jgi:hypothetical protein
MGLGGGDLLGVAAKVAGISSGWLASRGPVAAAGLEPLVDDALMRGMHVDDDQALGVLGQDVDAGSWASARPSGQSPAGRGIGRGQSVGDGGGMPSQPSRGRVSGVQHRTAAQRALPQRLQIRHAVSSRPGAACIGAWPLPGRQTAGHGRRRGAVWAGLQWPDGSAGRRQPTGAARCGASASSTAWRTAWCTSRLSRKRTSILVGCTFTSTRRGSMSRTAHRPAGAGRAARLRRRAHRAQHLVAHEAAVDIGRTAGRRARGPRPACRRGRAPAPGGPSPRWAASTGRLVRSMPERSSPSTSASAGLRDVLAGMRAPLRHQPAVVPDRKADVGPRQRVAAHRLEAVRQLGGIGLQELAPRRRAEEQLLAPRRWCRWRARRAQLAAAGVQRPGRVGGLRCARRGQSAIDAMAASASPRKPIVPTASRSAGCDLARGMALQRQRQLVARDAACRRPRPRSAHAAGQQPHRDLVAPASSALSTSSRTTEAGRSTTSPAAIWLISSSGSSGWRRGAGDGCHRRHSRKAGLGAQPPVIIRRHGRRAAWSTSSCMSTATWRRLRAGPTAPGSTRCCS